MDLDGADENLEIFKQRFPKQRIIPISASEEQNLEELRSYLEETVAYRPKDEEQG
jgi:GTP-binding protein